jgi:hypothetical protein
VGTGVLLILGLRLAPILPPSLIGPASIAWLLLLGFLALLAYRVLRAWLGPAGAIVALAMLLLTPVILTAVRPRGALAARWPCPRQWSALGAWTLRSSPMGSVRVMVGATPVRICYGRPAARGRRMLGGPPVPFGQLWRTGANEPTTIIAAGPITVAGIPMGAGRASLYSVPGPETWEIILNGSTSRWGGAAEYQEVRDQELGRSIVPSERSDRFVERLTIRPDSGGVVVEWETTRVRLALSEGGMR